MLSNLRCIGSREESHVHKYNYSVQLFYYYIIVLRYYKICTILNLNITYLQFYNINEEIY